MQEDARPEPCNENLIINELIREYLIFNGYRDTLSVFLPGELICHSEAACDPAHPVRLNTRFSCDQQRLPGGFMLHQHVWRVTSSRVCEAAKATVCRADPAAIFFVTAESGQPQTRPFDREFLVRMCLCLSACWLHCCSVIAGTSAAATSVATMPWSDTCRPMYASPPVFEARMAAWCTRW